MILDFLTKSGMPLPPAETEEGLTAKDIMDQIRDFYLRLEKYDGECDDFAEGYFLDLLRTYPRSMCSRQLTDTLKQIITTLYFESKPQTTDKDDWQGYSYEDLGMMFVRSKASIHEAIRDMEATVKPLIAEARLRKQARSIALDELVKEEKLKLQTTNNQTINQKNEQPLQSSGGNTLNDSS